MTITAVALQPGVQLGGAASLLVSAQTSPAQITTAVFTNTDASARTVTIYVVRSGGAPGPANTVMSAQSIAAGAVYIAKELAGRNLAVGDTLYGLASAAGVVNAFIDGFTIS